MSTHAHSNMGEKQNRSVQIVDITSIHIQKYKLLHVFYGVF
jgi:hypothetical protein